MNILDQNSIFTKSNQLLKNCVYIEVKHEPAFIKIKSIFKDAWYNFIIPTVSADKLPWNEVETIISQEKDQGVEMSFYVHDSFAQAYQDKLKSKGYQEFGSDVYMFLSFDKKFDGIQGEFNPVNQANLNEYLKIAKDCFPDWENEADYSKHFYDLSLKSSNKIYKSILLKVNHNYVAFGSIIISPQLNLAYLHNTGTSEPYRHQGYYTQTVKYRCNLALDEGVNQVYALVEQDSGSYQGLKKLGFETKEKFHLFAKE